MYLAIDTETTGTHDNAEIAQLALLLFDKDRRIMGEFKSLIRPDGWTMSDETAAWHAAQGSTVSMDNCIRFGLGLQSGLMLFNKWCSFASVLIAHNVKYDMGRLKFAAKKRDIELFAHQKTFCTQEEATPIMQMPPTERMIKFGHGNKFKTPSLKEAYAHFVGGEFNGAHDAMADVKAAAAVAFEIMDIQNGVKK